MIECEQLPIQQGTREWQETRTYIGGSDSAVALGLSQNKGVSSLAALITLKKMGLWEPAEPPTEEDIYFFRSIFPPKINLDFLFWFGHEREPIGIELYSLLTGNDVLEGFIWLPKDDKYRSFFHVSPDGMVRESQKKNQNYKIVLEVKSHVNKLPDKLPLDYICEIYQSFFLLDVRYVDYIGVAYDLSSQENFEKCKIVDVRFLRFHKSQTFLNWYKNGLFEFIRLFENSSSFPDNTSYKNYLESKFGKPPFQDLWEACQRYDGDHQYASLIREMKGRTLDQIKEIAEIIKSTDENCFYSSQESKKRTRDKKTHTPSPN